MASRQESSCIARPDQNIVRHEIPGWRYSLPVIWGRDAILPAVHDEDDQSLSNASSRPVEENPRPSPKKPYHVFSRTQKRALIYIVGLAGIVPTLTSNMYEPAHSAISLDMDVSAMDVQLTVTVFMAAQSIAPLIWVPISDTKGRRLVYVAAFLVFIAGNTGLALTDTYAVLMVYRVLQAVGCEALFLVGAGIIDDITTPEERSGLIGIVGAVRMFGQFIAPVIGGLITHYIGFHSIFTFLEALGCFALIAILFFVPETLRSIAGDGTVQLNGFYKPLFHCLQAKPDVAVKKVKQQSTPLRWQDIITPLHVLLEKDVFITVLFGGVVFSIWCMVTTSAAILFQTTFDLNDLHIGLAFLPNGAGCFLGTYCTGILLEHDHRKVAEAYKKSHRSTETDKATEEGLSSDSAFPTERARLRSIWPILLVFIAAVGLYGLSFSYELDGVLVLQFFIAFCATSISTSNMALLTALEPGKGTSASLTAVANLVRCGTAAVGVAIIDPMIRFFTPTFAFLVVSCAAVVLLPMLVWAELRYGPKWRAVRIKRLMAKDSE